MTVPVMVLSKRKNRKLKAEKMAQSGELGLGLLGSKKPRQKGRSGTCRVYPVVAWVSWVFFSDHA